MSIRYNDYETENDRDLLEASEGGADREISLGTATVLGIFLGLAVVCALFFGFGYSMGRKSVPSPLADVNTGVSDPLPGTRLTPGSVSGNDAASGGYVAPTVRSNGNDALTDTATGARAPVGQHTKPTAANVQVESGKTSPVAAAERQQVARAVATADGTSAPAPAKTVAAGTPGSMYVQVTAISQTHRADADMLVSSLRKKGYAAAIHQGATDGLLHVQLGPFPSKKDAEAVRQRLSGDGYNSILK